MTQRQEMDLIDSFLLDSENLQGDFQVDFYREPGKERLIPDLHFFGIDSVLCFSEVALEIFAEYLSCCDIRKIEIDGENYNIVVPFFREIIDIDKSDIKWYQDLPGDVAIGIKNPVFIPDAERYGIVRDKNFSFIRYIFPDRFVELFRARGMSDLKFRKIE